MGMGGTNSISATNEVMKKEDYDLLLLFDFALHFFHFSFYFA